MRKGIVALLAGCWILSLAAAGAAGWMAAQRWEAVPEASANAASRPDAAPPGKDANATGTPDEVAQLKTRLEKLQAERDKLGRDFLALAISQTMESGRSGSTDPRTIRMYWDQGTARLLRGRSLRNLDQSISLMMSMAAFGEPGIRFLGTVINDKNREDAERTLALEMLSYITDPVAFNLLASFRDDSIMELDYPYDLIRNQIAQLPTSAIAGRIPDIVNHIAAELGKDNYSPERVEVLFSLAAVHHDPRARQLLYDPRMWTENVRGAIDEAAALHNQDAWDYLRAIEENHQDPSVRAAATQVLNDW